MCQVSGQDKWKVFGITSWGIQCGDAGVPVDVYTRVVYYIDWIQNIMDQED